MHDAGLANFDVSAMIAAFDILQVIQNTFFFYVVVLKSIVTPSEPLPGKASDSIYGTCSLSVLGFLEACRTISGQSNTKKGFLLI